MKGTKTVKTMSASKAWTLWKTWSKNAEAVRFLESHFQRDIANYFVLSSNRIEGVGTQDEDGTREVLEQPFKRTRFSRQIERETRQTKDAVDFIWALWKDVTESETNVDNTTSLCTAALLTVPNILESHRMFMKGILPNPGELRTAEVYTLTESGVRYYEVSHKVGPLLQGLVDQLNVRLMQCNSIKDILGISSEWLLEFLKIHPFSDGNGRVGRLWLAYLLFPFFPFVISIPWGLRNDYIAALQDNAPVKVSSVIERSIGMAVSSFDAAMRRSR